MTKKPPDAGQQEAVEATGDAKLDELFARMTAKAAEEAEIEPLGGPESAPGDLPRGRGRGESAADGPEPPTARAEPRPDPLLPVVQSVSESPEREAARLAFAGILDADRTLPDAQLPLIPAPGPRVPLLELADYRGGPVMARGRGAPLDLRLLVGACIMTPRQTRLARGRLAVTVRELRDFCFPNGWERRRHWPAIRKALWRARDYVIPNECGALWLPFALRRDPGAAAGLDDLVLIDVELPPGSANGPPIARRELARLGVHSAPRFRAYIATHSVAWSPGVTRRPHPRNPRFHMWSADAEDYLILTRADRRRLAFGMNDKGNRTHASQDAAWEDLPGVEIVTRQASTPDGSEGWVIVPEAAAEAIRKAGGRDGLTSSAAEVFHNRPGRGRQP